MRKLLLAFSLFLVLVGCAVEDSPEAIFDRALVEIEEADSYGMQITLKRDDVVLFEVEFEKDGLSRHFSELVNLVTNSKMKDIYESLVDFTYTDVFGNFEMANGVIECDIDPEKSKTITDLISFYTSEAVESISHKMSVVGESMEDVEMTIKTKTQTYTLTMKKQ